jgi:hypothetical protein
MRVFCDSTLCRCTETSRHFRKKKREYLKDKINNLATNSKDKNIRDLDRGINGFKSGYRLRTNLVQDIDMVICLKIPTTF